MLKSLALAACLAIAAPSLSHAALVASYGLDGNGTDSSGNGLDLTLTNTSSATDRYGNAGGALQFDGSSSNGDYRGPNLAALNLGTRSWTVSAWFDTAGSSDAQIIVSRYRCGWTCSNGTTDSAMWELNLNNNTPELLVRTDVANTYIVSALGPVSTNAWHMLTGVVDQVAGLLSLYLDGTLAASMAYAPNETVSENGAPLEVGHRFVQTYLPDPTYFIGAIDDIAIYNTALTAQQVQDLANATIPEPAHAAVLGIVLAAMLARRRMSHFG